MHARLEELISLRDRQPVDAASASHVASCAQCAAEIRRLAALRAELTRLPGFTPPDLWPQIEARRGAASGSPPSSPWKHLTATASIVALVLALATALPQPRVAEPLAAQGAGGSMPLQSLVARSQRLETTLRQLPQRPAVEVAANSMAIDALQSRIQRLDMELTSDASVESDPDRQQELWSQRVSLLNSLFGVRYAEAVHAGYRAAQEEGSL
jgi:hypothetical protein